MRGIVVLYRKYDEIRGISMNIDKMNRVQSTSLTYTPTKYVKSDNEETDNKKDTLNLTKEAQQLLAKEKARKRGNRQNVGFLQQDLIRRQLEETNKKENKVANMSKCFKIAARIQNGDRVPLKDMKYLRENAPELYKSALLFKKHNPEPKKYKSCLDKEDEKSLGTKNSSLMEASVGADDAIVLDLNV